MTDKFDCGVISLRDEGTYGSRIRALGVPVHAMCIRGTEGLIPAGRRISQLIKKFRPEIIQGWMYHGNLAASFASFTSSYNPIEIWNVRHCIYNISDEKYLTRYVIKANKLVSSRAKAIIYNSYTSKEQHEIFGFKKESSIVIPNGFDLLELKQNIDTRNQIKNALGINSSDLVIGHVARFHPLKDHATFLRSAVKVARQHTALHFVIIGRDVDLMNPVLTGIVPGEIEKRFHFLGECSDVYDKMQVMDILCSSSVSEGFPNVLGEAMALGIPCVATDVGDSARVVSDTGIIVPPSEVDTLAQAMLNMLTLNPDQRKLLGKKARLRIETNYSLNNTVSRYADLYEKFGSEAQ